MTDIVFDPSRHAPLHAAVWDERRACAAIAGIASDTIAAASERGLWPVHPEDKDGDTPAFYDLYLGASGVVWALDELKRAGVLKNAFRPDLDLNDWIAANRACFPGYDRLESLLSGDAGLLMAQIRRAPSAQSSDALARAVETNLDHPAMELMWGASGSMLAALELHALTQDPKWIALYRRGVDFLLREFQLDAHAHVRIWTQSLWNRKSNMLGAVHGFAGNAMALIRGRTHFDPGAWAETSLALAETLERTAIRGEGGVNWPSHVGRDEPGRKMLLQICHGAPGMIVCMANLDQPIEELLAEAGETIWRAGPLAKGSNLCHGTAGNGYAFLKLFARTKDEKWLARARAFAMHAIAQNEAEVARYRMRRHSLWTGDLGLALYLNACVAGDARFPVLDVL
jgi:hypothetical protein